MDEKSDGDGWKRSEGYFSRVAEIQNVPAKDAIGPPLQEAKELTTAGFSPQIFRAPVSQCGMGG